MCLCACLCINVNADILGFGRGHTISWSWFYRPFDMANHLKWLLGTPCKLVLLLLMKGKHLPPRVCGRVFYTSEKKAWSQQLGLAELFWAWAEMLDPFGKAKKQVWSQQRVVWLGREGQDFPGQHWEHGVNGMRRRNMLPWASGWFSHSWGRSTPCSLPRKTFCILCIGNSLGWLGEGSNRQSYHVPVHILIESKGLDRIFFKQRFGMSARVSPNTPLWTMLHTYPEDKVPIVQVADC